MHIVGSDFALDLSVATEVERLLSEDILSDCAGVTSQKSDLRVAVLILAVLISLLVDLLAVLSSFFVIVITNEIIRWGINSHSVSLNSEAIIISIIPFARNSFVTQSVLNENKGLNCWVNITCIDASEWTVSIAHVRSPTSSKDSGIGRSTAFVTDCDLEGVVTTVHKVTNNVGVLNDCVCWSILQVNALIGLWINIRDFHRLGVVNCSNCVRLVSGPCDTKSVNVSKILLDICHGVRILTNAFYTNFWAITKCVSC